CRRQSAGTNGCHATRPHNQPPERSRSRNRELAVEQIRAGELGWDAIEASCALCTCVGACARNYRVLAVGRLASPRRPCEARGDRRAVFELVGAVAEKGTGAFVVVRIEDELLRSDPAVLEEGDAVHPHQGNGLPFDVGCLQAFHVNRLDNQFELKNVLARSGCLPEGTGKHRQNHCGRSLLGHFWLPLCRPVDAIKALGASLRRDSVSYSSLRYE